jgi:hypothetical protein
MGPWCCAVVITGLIGVAVVTSASAVPVVGEAFNLHVVNTPNPASDVITGLTADFTSPSAVPEPGTLILLGTGLAGAAAGAWRKRRHAS